MTSRRIAGPVTLVAALALAALAPSGIAGAVGPLPLPQTSSAQAAATWLAGQVVPGGYIASTVNPGTADLEATANTVLALASAGVGAAQAAAALSYLEGHVAAYVTVAGADGPGQLALLILDAHAQGVAPTNFGGTDLVARLVATQRSGGADSGLFGAQDPTYDGAYRQGLALAALAAAGVTSGSVVTGATGWLTAQQCPNGGWTSYITVGNPCNGKPANYAGPDTNSTALAVEGLAAQGALSPTGAAAALRFFKKAENADGGFGYEPNTVKSPGSTDPNSTALVIQALLALGAAPSSSTYAKGGGGPVASLVANQVTGGAGDGGISFPGISGVNLLATYQAIPALAGVTFAYNVGVPLVTHVGPSHGPTSGGTTVHIVGSSFAMATSVRFGTTPAASMIVVSGSKITAVAPPGALGTVDVTVTSAAGTSVVGSADRFGYR